VVTGGPPPGGVSVPVEDDGWSAGGKRPAGGAAGSAVSTVAPERIDKDPTAAPGYPLRVIDGDLDIGAGAIVHYACAAISPT